MKTVYLGRYNEDEILTGPEKVGKRIFEKSSEEEKTFFIEYFFDGDKYGLGKKLFGSEKVCSANGSDVLRLGIFTLFIRLINLKPEIIHIISFERFALIAFIYRVFFKTKIVYNVHGIAVHENNFFAKAGPMLSFRDSFAEEIFIGFSDRILLLSKNFRNMLERYYNVSKRKVRYIKNGADEEFGRITRVDSGVFKIVFISDIRRSEKGFAFLKDTLEHLNIKTELYVIDKKNIEREISFENGLVEFHAADKMNPAELSDFLKDKNVFVSPAEYEPFGITCAECMSAGLIPVVTSATGASELITDGLNGFIFEYGNSVQLIKILQSINENSGLREKLSAEAAKIYYSINWKEIFEDYKKIYGELLNQK